MDLPSGGQHRARTDPVWAGKGVSSRPARRSKRRTAPSEQPAARVRPSGEKARAPNVTPWPLAHAGPCGQDAGRGLASRPLHQHDAPFEEDGEGAAVRRVGQRRESTPDGAPCRIDGDQSFDAADLVAAGQVPETDGRRLVPPPKPGRQSEGLAVGRRRHGGEGRIVNVVVEAADAFALGDVPDGDRAETHAGTAPVGHDQLLAVGREHGGQAPVGGGDGKLTKDAAGAHVPQSHALEGRAVTRSLPSGEKAAPRPPRPS